MKDFDPVTGKMLPSVPMYGPIPKELMRNMPRWVYRLQLAAYWLMAPFAIAYLLALLYERTGILLP
jgi:hypothetical protein